MDPAGEGQRRLGDDEEWRRRVRAVELELRSADPARGARAVTARREGPATVAPSIHEAASAWMRSLRAPPPPPRSMRRRQRGSAPSAALSLHKAAPAWIHFLPPQASAGMDPLPPRPSATAATPSLPPRAGAATRPLRAPPPQLAPSCAAATTRPSVSCPRCSLPPPPRRRRHTITCRRRNSRRKERDMCIGLGGWIGFPKGILGIMNISYISIFILNQNLTD